MHVTLIQPAMGREADADKFVESWKMEPLSIAHLASLTPPEHQITFHDDRCEPIPFDTPTDLVGISAETYTAKRSYQIAAEFRKRGVPVVIGGYHATLVPDEPGAFCDAVVEGEAEGVWQRLLSDAARGQLERRYRSAARPPLAGLTPDRSIFSGKRYMPLTLVESGRGCHYSCDFCSIAGFYRKSFRQRPPADVAAEIESTGRRYVFLVDDNIVADFGRAKQLFRELAPLKVSWLSQGTLTMARDPELLDHLQKSGCAGLLVGFESLSPENLRAMRKSFNRVRGGYAENIARLRDRGIKIYATFVFGYDHDTPELFEQTLEFALEQRFYIAAFAHLQPFPGTPLYRRLEAEGRLLHRRWWLEPGVRFGQVIFRPALMSPAELRERLMEMRRRFFSASGILRRARDLRANLSSPASALFYLVSNALMRKELDEKFGLPIGDLSLPEPALMPAAA
jgi:radical SAM superfamily enzyme YgiQ (UPF0313 family)